MKCATILLSPPWQQLPTDLKNARVMLIFLFSWITLPATLMLGNQKKKNQVSTKLGLMV